jgi:hypothetical protein
MLWQDLKQARGHERAGAHVARFLLRPHYLAQAGVAGHEFEDLGLRERVQELDPPMATPPEAPPRAQASGRAAGDGCFDRSTVGRPTIARATKRISRRRGANR